MVAEQQGEPQPNTPVVLSMTNVAVSKQKALLHATQATQVYPAGNSAAANRIRHHALQHLAQNHLQSDPERPGAVEQSSALQVWLLMCDTALCIVPVQFQFQRSGGFQGRQDLTPDFA